MYAHHHNRCFGLSYVTHYVLLLCSFKEQLQQHVRVHAMEAVMACWELEQSLQSLTGVAPGEGTGATMSDDEDDQEDSGTNFYDASMDGTDTMGFGPLVPTETERSLMERVRQELKHELKQGYKEKIVDIREEILRKRRAGKLPGDTTSLLKAWWQAHAKWPYPTEDDKARLVQETGLQLKQINNWFINQRKRNWHSNPSSSGVIKSKRKSDDSKAPTPLDRKASKPDDGEQCGDQCNQNAYSCYNSCDRLDDDCSDACDDALNDCLDKCPPALPSGAVANVAEPGQ
ncbi:uncharacterized protein A4U43_C08F8080 [Asparagus officinalis]|nr:uncharacterized protein A4U43_C08F8080 [Asparagus officinalis]